jgi:23S rRNA pseudouridine2604 synthase
MNEKKRLNKYISETGFCSRRGADTLISDGLVTINDTMATLGMTVGPDDIVKVNGTLISPPKSMPIYIAFHKPKGITSTTDLKDPDNMIDYIGFPQRIFPIGRLDKQSEGLIFLTNNGDIVNKILRAGNHHEKEYIVTVTEPLTNDFIVAMSQGVSILNTRTQPCQVIQLSTHRFKITLTQGLNRQIRRMCAVYRYEVKRLVRTRIMNIHLEGIAKGTWRYLTQEEIHVIHQLVADSIKTEEGSYLEDLLPEELMEEDFMTED